MRTGIAVRAENPQVTLKGMKMRRILCAVLAVGVTFSLTAAPAGAEGKRRISDQWTAEAPLPYPSLPPGCTQGMEGMHKESYGLTTPGPGTLEVTMANFHGDWDLWVMNAKNRPIASSRALNADSFESVRIKLKGNQQISIVACNGAGGPAAEVAFSYVYTD